RGIFVFCNELWTSYLLNHRREHDDRQGEQYTFDQYLLMGAGFVDWKPFKHPHYGDVEIGGFKKTYGRLHPGFLLESDAHRNMAFTLYHAYNTPKLDVAEIDVQDLGGGLKEVTAVVTNSRLIPTHSSVDVQNRIEVPDVISLSGGDVLSGMVVDDRDLGLTTEQRNDPANIRVANIPGNSHVTVRWIVRGGNKFTVTVDSKKGGTDSKTM